MLKSDIQKVREECIAEIISAFEDKIPVTVIAEQYDVTKYYITKWLKDEGYIVGKGRRPTLAAVARARDLAARNWPREEIGHLLNVREERVDKWLDRKNEPIHKNGEPPISIKGDLLKPYPFLKAQCNTAKKEPMHKHGKRWNLAQELHVLDLIEKGLSPGEIYRKSRASKKKQARLVALCSKKVSGVSIKKGEVHVLLDTDEWFEVPKCNTNLQGAQSEQLECWELSEDGKRIAWKNLGEELSVPKLVLRAIRSRKLFQIFSADAVIRALPEQNNKSSNSTEENQDGPTEGEKTNAQNTNRLSPSVLEIARDLLSDMNDDDAEIHPMEDGESIRIDWKTPGNGDVCLSIHTSGSIGILMKDTNNRTIGASKAIIKILQKPSD